MDADKDCDKITGQNKSTQKHKKTKVEQVRIFLT